ncbi:MAG: 16S rRNA (uracil(1498)-N(3))-methyltransferase [[Clostridium] aminophilum]|uniref:16S rRNA (uracil(1498)-N(3))-methyltransferase n=1 Tax=[Clostridium] aminophilum TaxID=1526 RepID=UPI0026EBC7C2|nr:16S rRNA (uracil(1498)-N(3))-methyltransferase [[Clostridium] aminophilum]MDD6196835.1 16S rRNA (uracil(1498)-N(3))-methyltransferase [[Clostridium] aminophilum]
MYHFFVEPDQIEEERITILGEDVNHIGNVLRMKPGEKVLISAEGEMDRLCGIEEIRRDEVICRILEVRKENNELPARIHLYQGLPKSDKMELIIQKAVELGAYRIVPVSTKNTVVKLDAKKAESKVKRWNAIALAAAKQSKRSVIPEVAPVISFGQALEEVKGFGLKLIPYENADGMAKTRELMGKAAPGQDIAVFIGPEGGFDPGEIEKAKDAGIEPVTLGKRILRTETAGLCILSALMMQLDDC